MTPPPTFGNSASLRDVDTPESELVGPGREGRLMLDNYGGIGVFPIGCDLDEPRPGVASANLPPGHVLWISICPPRPFAWEQSFHDRPFMYGSGNRIEQAYPSDEGLANHLAFVGNIYHLHDLVLWENWQSSYVPSRGAEALTRVRDTVHRLGARLIVYTSPQYFTRGTPNEHRATGAQMVRETGTMKPGPPWYGGENMDLFLPEIERVVKEYGMDGLYFDGLYCNSLVQSYRVMRESRKILGDRLLSVHTTWSPPGLAATGYCPTVDAYADFVLRGEDNPRLAVDALWQRYLVSGYNISNAIGMPEHNKVPDAELRNDAFVDAILDVNARFYYHDELGRERITGYYWPQLTERLKARVDRVMAERNAAFTETHFLRSPRTEESR